MRKIKIGGKIALYLFFGLALALYGFGSFSLPANAVGHDVIEYGSESEFNNATSSYIKTAKLTDTKFVTVYLDEGTNYGTAVIGERSGTSITFGSEYVFNSDYIGLNSVARLSDTSFVIVYEDTGNGDYGTAVVGTVSGTTISFGSEYVFESDYSNCPSVAALDSTHFVATWAGPGVSYIGKSVIGTVSGTTISYGSTYNFNNAATSENSVSKLTSSKFVVSYHDTGNSDYGTSIVGTVSGSTISYGSEYVYNAASTDNIASTRLNDEKFVATYRDNGNSDYGTAIVGGVSGTTISFGNETVFNTANIGDEGNSVSALSAGHFVAAYQDYGNSYYGTARMGDVMGKKIFFGSEYVYNSTGSSYNAIACLGATDCAISYQHISGYGKGKIGHIYLLEESKSVVIDATSKYIASVVKEEGHISVYYEASDGFYKRDQVIDGTGFTIDLDGGRAVKSNTANHIYFAYTKTGSPTELHLVHYDYLNDIIDFDNTVYSDVNVHFAMSRDLESINSVNTPALAYSRSDGGNMRAYYYNGSSWTDEAITGTDVLDAPMAMDVDADDDFHVAYQDYSDTDLKAISYDVVTDTQVYHQTIDTLADLNYDISDAGIDTNGYLQVVYQKSDYDLVVANWDGVSAYDPDIFDSTLSEPVSFDADIDPDDSSKVRVIYNDGTGLKEKTVAVATGVTTATNTIDSSTDAKLGVSVAGVDSSSNLLVSYITNATGGDILYKVEEQSGGGYYTPIQMNQEEGGPTIPELPKNNVWKIVIAMFALFAVVVVVAWRSKKVSRDETEEK